jgi:hypothetical protein
MAPTPAMWLSVPERSIERVGEHAEAVWKSVKRRPWEVASLCKLGVAISPPKGEVSELRVRLWGNGVCTIRDRQRR